MIRNGQKETDIKISLKNLGTVNKNSVTIANSNKQVSLYFSYDTLIAVDDIVSENNWSVTTGKFLNELEPNHKNRISHEQVLTEAQRRLKAVLYSEPELTAREV